MLFSFEIVQTQLLFLPLLLPVVFQVGLVRGRSGWSGHRAKYQQHGAETFGSHGGVRCEHCHLQTIGIVDNILLQGLPKLCESASQGGMVPFD